MFESTRARATIVLLSIAAIVAIVLPASHYTFQTTSTINSSGSGLAQTPQPAQRGPPSPMPITTWGNQDTFDHAKSLPGMSWISLPTKVPPNLTLAPIRVKTDSVVTTISAIFTPPGVSTSDNVTGDEVANAGGFSVTYWKQAGPLGANQTKQFEDV